MLQGEPLRSSAHGCSVTGTGGAACSRNGRRWQATAGADGKLRWRLILYAMRCNSFSQKGCAARLLQDMEVLGKLGLMTFVDGGSPVVRTTSAEDAQRFVEKISQLSVTAENRVRDSLRLSVVTPLTVCAVGLSDPCESLRASLRYAHPLCSAGPDDNLAYCDSHHGGPY